MKNNFKLKVILIIIVLLVCGVAFVAWHWNKNSSTAISVVSENSPLAAVSFLSPKAGDAYTINITHPETVQIRWTPFALGPYEHISFWLGKKDMGELIMLGNSSPDFSKNDPVQNIDIAAGSASWKITDNGGSLETTTQYPSDEYFIEIMLEKQTDCFAGERCGPTGPFYETVATATSPMFKLYGPML